jgi:hypothetical protein
MSWLRIEGKMPWHAKVAPLNDAAFRLHVTAMAWSVEHQTDGVIPNGIPATLPGAPRGKKLALVVDVLHRVMLWEVSPDGSGWVIHDFLDWNISAAEHRANRAAKAAAGAAGGRASGKQRRSKDEAGASDPLKQNASKSEAKPNETRTETKPDSDSDSETDLKGPSSEDLTAFVSCPADLTLTSAMAMNAKMGHGLSDEAIRRITVRYRGSYLGKPEEKRTLGQWLSGLNTAVCVGGREEEKTVRGEAKAPDPAATERLRAERKAQAAADLERHTAEVAARVAARKAEQAKAAS